MNAFVPVLVRSPGEIPRLGEPFLDEYLRFVAARARTNTLLAQTFDLKVFFTIIGKEPAQVSTSDILAFVQAQRLPRKENVVWLVRAQHLCDPPACEGQQACSGGLRLGLRGDPATGPGQRPV